MPTELQTHPCPGCDTQCSCDAFYEGARCRHCGRDYDGPTQRDYDREESLSIDRQYARSINRRFG